MSIVGEGAFKEYVEKYPTDETEDTQGINFVSLLKNKDFYFYYNKPDETIVKNYTKYFREYMFKGKCLLDFWGNKNNPMFLMTWAVVKANLISKNIQTQKEKI